MPLKSPFVIFLFLYKRSCVLLYWIEITGCGKWHEELTAHHVIATVIHAKLQSHSSHLVAAVGSALAAVVRTDSDCIVLQAAQGLSTVSIVMLSQWALRESVSKLLVACQWSKTWMQGRSTMLQGADGHECSNAVWKGASDRWSGSHQSEDWRVDKDWWYSQVILFNRGEGQERADSWRRGSCQEESSKPPEADKASVCARQSCVKAPRNPSQGNQDSYCGQQACLLQEKVEGVWWLRYLL